MRWDDVNARARGLATHLLGRDRLIRLGGAGSWQAAARRAIDDGFPVEPALAASAPDFDRAIGRVVAGRLEVLGRWLDDRRRALALVYEDEERRTLRALLRGAAAGTAPLARLHSLTPTPGLPERTMERLAHAESPAGLIRMLVRHGHPAGRALQAAQLDGRPGLFGLELALSRLFAARAVRGARRAGPTVRRFAALAIDRENAWSLLAAPSWAADCPAGQVFLEGGEFLGSESFAAIARLVSPNDIRSRLAETFRESPLAPVFADPAAPDATLESRALAAQAAWYRRVGRLDPLGPGVLFSVIERIRAEAHDLRVVLGALVAGGPAGPVESLLVTAR